MSESAERKDAPGGALSAIDSVGVACTRASSAALLVALVEGGIVATRVGHGGAGLVLATAGVWFPAALVSLLVGSILVRAANDRRRRTLTAAVFGVSLVVGAVVAATVHAPIGVAPLEIAGILFAGWGASLVRLDAPIRRPAALVGIGLTLLVQLYAQRWIDVHRALAGALVEQTFVPRAMLRFVLRRFV